MTTAGQAGHYPPMGKPRLWLTRILNLVFYWEWTKR